MRARRAERFGSRRADAAARPCDERDAAGKAVRIGHSAASSGLAAGDQRERRAAFLLRQVGERGGIVAGEAGVAALRLLTIALLAERPVQTLDRDEREAVGVNVIAHLLDVHLRREELRTLGCIHA